MNKRIIFVLVCVLPLALSGCGGDLGQKMIPDQNPIKFEENDSSFESKALEIELGNEASSAVPTSSIDLPKPASAVTTTKKVNKFYPDVASSGKASTTPNPDKDFVVTPELLAKMYLVDKYKPGICYGMPGPVPEEAVAGMIARNSQLAKFLKQKYGLSGDLDVYNKIKQLNGISLDKLGSGRFNFEFMDGQCCTMTGYQGEVIIIGSSITDKVNNQETKTNPC
ncbi:MAG: hypothetical protein WC516_02025 [Patescibacteria group bacterium]